MKHITIACDGACSGNGKEKSPGGWGAILTYKDATKEISGGAADTTNNIMELTAAIEALALITTKDADIRILSDSAYVVNCFRQKWYIKWRQNGWQTAKKEPVENRALWETLIESVSSFHRVAFYKIKGHLDTSNPSSVNTWLKKFNSANALSIDTAEFLELIALNQRADALANEGMAPYKQK